MRVIVPQIIQQELLTALRMAGTREVGGILMGEHLSEQSFAVRNITVQVEGGTFGTFVRLIQNVLQPLAKFFRQSNHDYRRFNYLGEWHSHPSFAPVPSRRDEATMWEIVTDPAVGANFTVLMILKLDERGALIGTTTIYASGRYQERAELVLEDERRE